VTLNGSNDHGTVQSALDVALTVEEAAKAAGVGRTTIFFELRNGRLKARKVGRRTVIAVADLHAWLEALPRSRSGLKSD
jgi:excisionase family DNA binding protein